MHKKYFIMIVTLSLLILMVGCNLNENDERYETPHFDDFEITYVDGDEQKTVMLNLSADYNEIINKWLMLNQLDEQYELIDSVIGEVDVSDTAKEFKYSFSYGNYIFFFSSNLEEFLTMKENSLYYDSLMDTLNSASNKITSIYASNVQ